MSHYEERLERDLKGLHAEVREIGEAVAGAIERAVRSVLTGDRPLAARTVLGDLPINRCTRRLDRSCHLFVARHLPSAGQLRFISSVMRLSIALERIGDYAVSIARGAVQLDGPPPQEVSRDIQALSRQAVSMLRQAIEAFDEDNAELARGTQGMAAQVAATFTLIHSDLVQVGEAGGHRIQDLFAQLVILNSLERVSDQAKNICEETIFTVTGEGKAPKVYRILLVDEHDDCLSQIAVAYGRKAFAGSGHFESAGWAPAQEIEPRCTRFLDENGYPVTSLAPSPLDPRREFLDGYHVIVGLGCDLFERLEEVPFHAVCLRWDVDLDTEGADPAQRFTLVHRRIAAEIRGLMATLRGEERT